ANALAFQVSCFTDRRVGAQVDRVLAEDARREYRDGDEARIALGAQDAVGGKRHLGGVELLVVEHAPEGLARPQCKVVQLVNALGVGEVLKALSCEAQGKEIRLWNSGETWKLFDLGPVSIERYGFPYFTVYRPDLLDVLARAVRREKADAIHLGAKCAGFAQDDDSVTLQLENGARVRADALIGADGVH